MKLVSFILLSVFLFSCKKEKVLHYSISATMQIGNGKPFLINLVDNETKFTRELDVGGEHLEIAGKKKDQYDFTIGLYFPAEGSFDLSARPAFSSVNYLSPEIVPPYKFIYSSSYGTGSGIIKIQSLTNDAARGSFHAICIEATTGDTLTITNGYFDGKFN
jgi:hypothetical protein